MGSSSGSSSDSWLTEFRPLSRISWYSWGSADGKARGQGGLSHGFPSHPRLAPSAKSTGEPGLDFAQPQLASSSAPGSVPQPAPCAALPCLPRASRAGSDAAESTAAAARAPSRPGERESGAATLLAGWERGAAAVTPGQGPAAAKGTCRDSLGQAEGRRHSRSLKEPPRFCTRLRPKALCGRKKRRRRCGYCASAALERGAGTCTPSQPPPPRSLSQAFERLFALPR